MLPTKAKALKRINNIYQQICSMDNLVLADTLASKGKASTPAVIRHRANANKRLEQLQNRLQNKTFTTSRYKVFTINDGKERLIYSLPYYPDRIVHHAIMNVLEPMFMQVFTADTYSSIKGRGIHSAAGKLKKVLKNAADTRYCLKLDIKKFYPSVDNTVLKQLLRKKIKCADTLFLLDNIIDSSTGLPIGNYLSQYLANYYLTWFDHWIKEQKGIKHYFRYADDIVILSSDKQHLHSILADIKNYLSANLNLYVKDNYQIFPVESRGIDFMGYKFFHGHTLLRKSIKHRFVKMVRYTPSLPSIAAYNGWLLHCNSRNLRNKFLNKKRLENELQSNCLCW